MSGDHYPLAARASGDLSGAAFLAVPRFIPHEVGGSRAPADEQQSSRCGLVTKPLLSSHLELGPLVTAPGSARGHVRAVLKEWALDELTAVTELLVSELITNAVLATRALDAPLPFSVLLWLHANRRRVLITVWDADPQPPVLQENIDRYAENGRGLMLVDTLSGHWGWYEPPVMGGKCVWCEIPRSPAC